MNELLAQLVLYRSTITRLENEFQQIKTEFQISGAAWTADMWNENKELAKTHAKNVDRFWKAHGHLQKIRHHLHQLQDALVILQSNVVTTEVKAYEISQTAEAGETANWLKAQSVIDLY